MQPTIQTTTKNKKNSLKITFCGSHATVVLLLAVAIVANGRVALDVFAVGQLAVFRRIDFGHWYGRCELLQFLGCLFICRAELLTVVAPE